MCKNTGGNIRMINLITQWFNSLWGSMEKDITFVVIGGLILLICQLINAGFGIWKNIGKKGEPFDFNLFITSFLKELGLIILLGVIIAVTYMTANLASLSILPDFQVGDTPTLALLAAYGQQILKKITNMISNLLVIMNGNGEDPKEMELIGEEV